MKVGTEMMILIEQNTSIQINRIKSPETERQFRRTSVESGVHIKCFKNLCDTPCVSVIPIVIIFCMFYKTTQTNLRYGNFNKYYQIKSK